jgi:DNA-binding GntR family transcriptional regulator
MEDTSELLSAKAYAIKRIRSMIHGGAFDDDEKLSIIALSQTLGISRTPVRDALWQLAAEGLVTVSPRVGAFLRHVTPREAQDIYSLKSAVEPLMVGWAAERAPEPVRRAYRQKVAELEQIAHEDDIERYVACLEQCRASLMAMADSPPVVDILSVIDGRVRLLRLRNLSQPGQLVVSAQEHVEVAEAIASGDATAATAAMAAHMRDASRRVQRLAERAESQDGAYWLSSSAPVAREASH